MRKMNVESELGNFWGSRIRDLVWIYPKSNDAQANQFGCLRHAHIAGITSSLRFCSFICVFPVSVWLLAAGRCRFYLTLH